MEDKKEIAYNWIMKIIESCTDTFHFDGIMILITLFEKQFQDKGGVMSVNLRRAKSDKFLEIHNILN